MGKVDNTQNTPSKALLWLIFFMYLLAVVSLLLFKWLPIPGVFPFPPDIHPVSTGFDTTLNLSPFQSIRLYQEAYGTSLSDQTIWSNLLGNVLVLFPFGFMGALLARRFRPWLILLSGLCLILGIELTQLLTGLGVWDIDDILLNTLGLILGLIFALPFRLLLYRERRSHVKSK